MAIPAAGTIGLGGALYTAQLKLPFTLYERCRLTSSRASEATSAC